MEKDKEQQKEIMEFQMFTFENGTEICKISLDNKTAKQLADDLQRAVEESNDHQTQWDVNINQIDRRLHICVYKK